MYAIIFKLRARPGYLSPFFPFLSETSFITKCSKNSLRAPVCGREARLDVYIEMVVPRKIFGIQSATALKRI